MTEYVSKQVQINRPESMVYEALCNFDNFTPILKDRVEQWCAAEESCSFVAKGFTVKLKMIERTPTNLIKITGEDMPFEFYFWVQLKSVDAYDTRLRLTLKAKLNTMMKMMVGKKLQAALDQIADQLAFGFNAR